jgi:hypothetical protein
VINLKKGLAALAVALAVTVVGSPSYAHDGGVKISPKRARAIHECSVLEERYPEYLWGNLGRYQYGACMAEHGEPE